MYKNYKIHKLTMNIPKISYKKLYVGFEHSIVQQRGAATYLGPQDPFNLTFRREVRVGTPQSHLLY